MRAIHGEFVTWGHQEYIQAGILNAVRAGNWQRGGGKGNRPKPVMPPARSGDRFGTRGRPKAEMRAMLDRWKAGELEAAS
jgi:hypothetical protein